MEVQQIAARKLQYESIGKIKLSVPNILNRVLVGEICSIRLQICT
jgi:hypothetical protein